MDSTGGDLAHAAIAVDPEYQEKGPNTASVQDHVRDNAEAEKLEREQETVGYEHEIQSSGSSSTDEKDLEKLDSTIVHVKEAKEGDELYAHLPGHERDIIKRQLDLPPVKANYLTLYRYATRNDILILIISALCAIIGGAVMPLMTVSCSAEVTWQTQADMARSSLVNWRELSRDSSAGLCLTTHLTPTSAASPYISCTSPLENSSPFTSQPWASYTLANTLARR